jgi:hypothetical protein
MNAPRGMTLGNTLKAVCALTLPHEYQSAACLHVIFALMLRLIPTIGLFMGNLMIVREFVPPEFSHETGRK